MKIIITESQRRMILTESIGEEMGEIVKEGEAKVEKLVEEAKSQMGLNLQFLLTWGAGIGGVMGPVESFVRGEFNGLSEKDILLIIVSVISIHFFDGKDYIKRLKKEIKERGLVDVFKTTLSKTKELTKTLYNFVGSLGTTFHKFTNLLSYSFILPLIVPILEFIWSGNLDPEVLKLLPIRVAGFVGATVSGILARELIFKMIKRFKE